MRAVHVRIRHNDDFVIAKLRNVKIFMYSGTKGADHGFDLVIPIDPVQPCLLHIQDLAPKRKDRLGHTVSRRFGGTSRGISFYQIDLAVYRVLIRTVRQLSRKRESVQSGLSSCQLPGFSRRLPGALGQDGFLQDQLRHLGILLQIDGQPFRHDTVHRASRLRIAQASLGLPSQLGLADLHADDRGQPFPDILAGQIALGILQKLVLSGIIIKSLGHGAFKPRQMGPAFMGVDIIDKTVTIFGIGIAVLERHFHLNSVFHSFTIDNILINGRIAPVQILDKFFDAALIVIYFGPDRVFSLVRQCNFQPLCQKSRFPKPDLKRLKIEFGRFKNLLVRKERDGRSGQVRFAGADHLQGIAHFSLLISLSVQLSFAADRYLQPLGKRVDDGRAHAVKSSGYLVSAAAEFTSCMQDGEYHFHRRLSRLMVDSRGDAPSVILHCNGIIFMYGHLNMTAVSGQRFINGIIHDLIDQMMQSSEGDVINIHSGPFPDRLKSFQDLDLVRAIFYIVCTHCSASC